MVRRHGFAIGAFVLGALAAAFLIVPLLAHRATARSIAADLRGLLPIPQMYGDARAATIDCWGDSLTAGKGAGLGHDFPSLLGFLFDRPANNKGVAGETSRQIATRMLSRTVSDTPESVVLWAGRNDDLSDLSATEGNIDGMIASLPAGSRYLVLGMLNGDMQRERRGGDRYAAILALNRDLQQRYGANFVPIREILVAHGRNGSDDDRAAAADDVVPPSLRADALHLNARGQAAVAIALDEAMIANGW